MSEIETKFTEGRVQCVCKHSVLQLFPECNGRCWCDWWYFETSPVIRYPSSNAGDFYFIYYTCILGWRWGHVSRVQEATKDTIHKPVSTGKTHPKYVDVLFWRHM